jgi:hypothetical protein
VPQTEMMKTRTRLHSAIDFCGGFDLNPHSADVTQIIDIFEKFQPGKFYLPNFSG